MSAETVKWNLRNNYCILRSTVKQFFFDRERRNELKKNEILKNSHKGERCFILGNGPSLKLYDLSCLEQEFVFAVNDFIRFPLLDVVKPDIYVVADRTFFELNMENEQDRIFSEKIKSLTDTNSELKLFAPISAKSVIDNYGWNQELNINYFNSYIHMYKGYKKELNLSSLIPGMQNVVQYCILIAIYMGFSEIYLLGTDQTNIFGNLKAYMSNDISDYAYQFSEEEKAWKHQKLVSHDLVDTLRGYARIFELFDILNDYCNDRGILLRNCAPETLITSIKKTCFTDLFE